MSRKHISALAILFILLSFLIASCAPKIVPDRVRTKKVYLSADPAKLLQDLIERNAGIKTLRTSHGHLEYRFTYAEKNYRGTELIFAVDKPGKVYARGKAGVAGTVFTLVSDGKKFWAEIPRDNKVYIGSVNKRISMERREGAELWQGFNPSVLSEALLLDNLSGYKRTTFAIHPDYYIIELLDEIDGTLVVRRRIWFDREDLMVRRHWIYNDSGELMTEAYLFKYVDVAGVMLAQSYRIERYWEEMTLNLQLNDIILNSELNENLFTYEIPAGFEVIDLEEKD